MRSLTRGGLEVRPRVADAAAKLLEEWIATSRYPIHSKLPPERELASTLGLSRGKLREALRRLESDGKIWRHVGVGTYVGSRPASVQSSLASLSAATTLSEILETRLAIEPILARFAAIRATDAEIAMAQHYMSKGARCSDWEQWEAWDERFHRTIAEASGNGILISIADQLLRIKMHARWTVKTSARFDSALVARYTNEHELLMAAIAKKDPAAAEHAMRQHMLALGRTIGPVITGRSAREGDA